MAGNSADEYVEERGGGGLCGRTWLRVIKLVSGMCVIKTSFIIYFCTGRKYVKCEEAVTHSMRALFVLLGPVCLLCNVLTCILN